MVLPGNPLGSWQRRWRHCCPSYYSPFNDALALYAWYWPWCCLHLNRFEQRGLWCRMFGRINPARRCWTTFNCTMNGLWESFRDQATNQSLVWNDDALTLAVNLIPPDIPVLSESFQLSLIVCRFVVVCFQVASSLVGYKLVWLAESEANPYPLTLSNLACMFTQILAIDGFRISPCHNP